MFRAKILIRPFARHFMSVACTGRVRVIEQLGEKQDFEAELSRRGFRHEEFELHVEAVKSSRSAAGWDAGYEVEVRHDPTQEVRTYRGGPRRNWVRSFVKDLVAGQYGEPTLPLARDVQDVLRRGPRTA
jgi:hypothetical protein